MTFRLLSLFCVALALPATERWTVSRSGPFEVLTDAGSREGQSTLYDLEQFRYALGDVLGEKELHSVWPIRIVLYRSSKDLANSGAGPGLALARDTYTGAAAAKSPLPAAILRDCASILIRSNLNRLPGDIESGLPVLFSTVTMDGSRITLGQAPPAAERNQAWAELHMLTVTPDYYGKLRVLVHNLQEGVAAEPAYRNAFGKSPAEVSKQASTYLASGNFPTVAISGKTIRPEKDFTEGPAAPGMEQAALADLQLAAPDRAKEAQAAYEAMLRASPDSPEAHEGLALLALRAGRKEEAFQDLTAAVNGGSKSARAYLEYALREPEPEKARAALAKAASLNPRWAAPPFELAQHETDPRKRLQLLSKAAELEPRNTGYWRALAEASEEQNQFDEAAKSWAKAEQSAPDDAERARLREVRNEARRKRLEHEEAEKKRLAEEKQRELEKLKQEAVASIQAALEKANEANPPAKTEAKKEVVPWWEDRQAPDKLRGVLQHVDCLGTEVRLVIQTQDRKQTRLLIRDPSKVVLRGGGQLSLGCGAQRPARKIAVEYIPKRDPKLGTAGEVAVIDFSE